MRPLTMCIVDDDPDFVRGMEMVLRERGYTVFVAHTGQVAVETVLAKALRS